MSAKKIDLVQSKSIGLYNKESGLIFKSKEEKVVIGRVNEKKEVFPFDQETLELCEKYGFEPDPSKIQTEEDPEEEKTSVSDETEKVSEPDLPVPIKQTEVKTEPVSDKKSKGETTVKFNVIQLELDTMKNTTITKIQQLLTENFSQSLSRISELETELAKTKKELAESKVKLAKFAELLSS